MIEDEGLSKDSENGRSVRRTKWKKSEVSAVEKFDITKKVEVGPAVVAPESDWGNVEYKRQITTSSMARLRTLATQLSFRLDEGCGTAIYQIGVEDDGRHSMLDESVVQNSVAVLELLARSLNAVLLETRYVQNEFHRPNAKPTRCRVTLQRVETHLLDQEPLSLASIAAMAATLCPPAAPATNAESIPSIQSSAPLNTSTPPPTKNAAQQMLSETLSTRNIRIAVVGDVDAGKSTLVGTLTTSILDDGKGKCRTSIMTHRHEIESGRTSTATSHLLGFRRSGDPVSGLDGRLRARRRKTDDQIAKESHRVVTLMDLAGHTRYSRTTLHGVSNGFADYSLLLVDARKPPSEAANHHLNLCCSFGIPPIVVLTKIDKCPQNGGPQATKACREAVRQMLRSPDGGRRRTQYPIRTEADIEACIDKMLTPTSHHHGANTLAPIAPVLELSCVTGKGLDLLKKLLFALPKRRRHDRKVTRPFEFLVEEVFENVLGVEVDMDLHSDKPDTDGSSVVVAAGFVNAGELHVGPECFVHVGPTDDGKFLRAVAKSAHVARINTAHVTAGQCACLALYADHGFHGDMTKLVRRGMVVTKDTTTPVQQMQQHSVSRTCTGPPLVSPIPGLHYYYGTKEFDAEICVLGSEGTRTTVRLQRSYQAYVHILNVRQSAYARNIELVETGVSHGQLPSNSEKCENQEEEKQEADSDEDGVVLRPGSRAKVRFEFAQRPEYIRPGMRMLFRDGRVKGVGIITAIPPPRIAPPQQLQVVS